MAVNLSPVGGVAAQFFTNTGAVLTGGKLYTYLAGTTTPTPTYTTNAGNVARTNPVVLDAAGRVPGSGEIWVSAGISYKFVLTDSNDVLIATYDNILNLVNSSADFVTYTPAGTGAVTTTVQAKLRQTVSIKDFGATGNGTTDDTLAIQNAIDACFTTGQTVYVNAGTYAITGVKIYPSTELTFDADATFKLTANGFAIRTSTSPSTTVPTTSVRFAKINNAQIDMNNFTGAGIFFEGAQSSVIENAYIYNVGSGTFTYDDGVAVSSSYPTSAIMLKGITGRAGPFYNQINHCRANGSGSVSVSSGIWLGTTIGSTDNQRPNLNQINQCVFIDFGEGVSMWIGSDNRFVQPEVSDCGTGVVVGNPSLYTLRSNGNQFYQIYAESCVTGVDLTTDSLDTTIFGFASLSGTTTGITDNGERTYIAELRGTSQITNTPRSYLGGFILPNPGTATGGTSASEILGYYDEGVFTPILADNATGGNSATAAEIDGLYTRIGNRVFVTISFTNINTTGMTPGSATFIRNLPWDVNSAPSLRSAGAVAFNSITTATGCITAQAVASTNYIALFEQTTTGSTGLISSKFTSLQADLYIELSYQV